MPFFENIKEENTRKIKLFGKIIYETISNYQERIQKYFGGLISTQKNLDIEYSEVKLFKFLNFVFLKSELNDDYEKVYLFNKLILQIDLKRKYVNTYKEYIEGYNDIIILNANSGESYLFLTYVLAAFLKKIASDNILLIATKKYHIDLINMLCPELKYCYVKDIKIFKKIFIKIGNQNFYTMFPRGHFVNIEKDIKMNKGKTDHYFYSILKELDIKENELNYRKVKIHESIKQNVIQKAKQSGLNLENFVFISPEACTCSEYDNKFWSELCNILQKEGYDVFMNIVKNRTIINDCSYKTFDLTFSEAFALAQMSKVIVSLRSGLTEILLQTNVPIFCLYTGFRNRYLFNEMNVENVMSGFGLSVLPNIYLDKLYEINMEKTNPSIIIENILSKLQENKKNKIMI